MQTKGEVTIATAAKWKMAMRDENTRKKQKPSEKTENMTQIQLKKQLTAQASRTSAFSETLFPITRLSIKTLTLKMFCCFVSVRMSIAKEGDFTCRDFIHKYIFICN